MALKQQIADDTKAALLGGNRFAGEVLRNLKGAILNEEVAHNKRDEGLNDAEVEAVIAREVKKRKESIALYQQNGRDDLADNEQQEVDVLETYLPKQLSEAELAGMVDGTIAELGATTMQDMGKVIGAVKAQAGTAADGATLAKLVKEKLQ